MMTDGMFCAKCLSQYQDNLSKDAIVRNWEIFKTG